MKIYKEAFTYVNIVESPLNAVLMDGFPSKVSRGWAEEIQLLPADLSSDPDDPEDKVCLLYYLPGTSANNDHLINICINTYNLSHRS